MLIRNTALWTPQTAAPPADLELLAAGFEGRIWSGNNPVGGPSGWTSTPPDTCDCIFGAFTMGSDLTQVDGQAASSIVLGGQNMVEIGKHSSTFPSPWISAPGWQFWYLLNPPTGSSQSIVVTLADPGGSGWGTGAYTSLGLWYMRGVDPVDPFGDTDFPNVTQAVVTSRSGTLGAWESADSVLLCAAAWQGADARLTFGDGITEDDQVSTGPSGTTNDARVMMGHKFPASPAAQPFSATSDMSNGAGIAAIEGLKVAA